MRKVLSVFGDEFFPKFGKGMSDRKREKAQSLIMEFFQNTAPELVYIMPTAGTCSYVAVLCAALKIPYIMIAPHPHFYDKVKINDKVCIKKAMEEAKSFILLNEKAPDDIEESLKLYKDSVDFMCGVSEAIVFFYSKQTTQEYKAFMDATCSKQENKHLWELVYDRENSFEI